MAASNYYIHDKTGLAIASIVEMKRKCIFRSFLWEAVGLSLHEYSLHFSQQNDYVTFVINMLKEIY